MAHYNLLVWSHETHWYMACTILLDIPEWPTLSVGQRHFRNINHCNSKRQLFVQWICPDPEPEYSHVVCRPRYYLPNHWTVTITMLPWRIIPSVFSSQHWKPTSNRNAAYIFIYIVYIHSTRVHPLHLVELNKTNFLWCSCFHCITDASLNAKSLITHTHNQTMSCWHWSLNWTTPTSRLWATITCHKRCLFLFYFRSKPRSLLPTICVVDVVVTRFGQLKNNK